MLQYSLCPREPQCQGDPASLLQDHHVNTQVSATAPLTVPVPSPAPLYTTQGYCCSHAGRFFKHIPGQGALTDLWGQLSLQYKWSWMAGSVSPADGSSHRCTAHRCTSPHCCCCSIHLEPSPLFCSRAVGFLPAADPLGLPASGACICLQRRASRFLCGSSGGGCWASPQGARQAIRLEQGWGERRPEDKSRSLLPGRKEHLFSCGCFFFFFLFSLTVCFFFFFFSTRASCCYGNEDGIGSPEPLAGLTEACK